MNVERGKVRECNPYQTSKFPTYILPKYARNSVPGEFSVTVDRSEMNLLEERLETYQCGKCHARFIRWAELIEHIEKGVHNSNIKQEFSLPEPMLTIEPVEDDDECIDSDTQTYWAENNELQSTDSNMQNDDEVKTEATQAYGYDYPQPVIKLEEGVEAPFFSDIKEERIILTPNVDDLLRDQEEEQGFNCKDCNAVFETSTSLRAHRRVHSFPCSDCEKTFRSATDLIKHNLRFHGGIYETELAPGTFHSDVFIIQKEGYHECEICGKQCVARSDMSKHVRRHTNERPYSCKICGESFKHLSSVSSHMRIHTGEKPFACQYCGKTFSQPSNQKRHEALHRGERPFNCDTCGKTFAEKTTLNTHILVHTGERPFICDICGRGHITNSAMVKHRLVHRRRN